MKSNLMPKVIGTNKEFVLKTGKTVRVVKLNNAATTSPFQQTMDAVNEYIETYGAFHRGAGPHANLTYEKTQTAIGYIKKFIGLGAEQSVLFTHNTSSAINLFIRILKLNSEDVIITSMIEHTSNNLPWSHNSAAKVVYVKAFDDGSLDYDDLENKIKEHSKRVKLVAITGASNLSGYIPDMPRIAKLAHEQGALLFVDAAQLAPHRPIDMVRDGIDALAFSAHKAYAPFGLGVLALPTKLLETEPVDPGGGSIDMISDTNIVWAPASIRHQTGTWNVTGIVATGESCHLLMETGWENVIAHEREIVAYAAEQLATVPKLTMYVAPEKYVTDDRIGTFVFNLEGYHHAHLAAILENEYGIETRAGTICNHKLVRRWMKIDDAAQTEIEKEIMAGNRLASYGIVRASLAIHNTKEDIDALVSALKQIEKNSTQLKYKPVPEEEIYTVA